MRIWHLMIYKKNFNQNTINDFFANIYHHRDQNGIHFKKMNIDADSSQMIASTLWFDSDNKLNNTVITTFIKYLYAQLLVGPKVDLPILAKVLREDFKTLGIEYLVLNKLEMNLTFWGVASDANFEKPETSNNEEKQQ